VVQLLLSKGADVNAKDVRGCVALHYAAYTCSKDVVMSLMQHRADVTIMNVDGETPHDITGKSRLAPRGVANEISALLLGKEPVPQKKGGCTVC
jgi:ankyrin repeat protein